MATLKGAIKSYNATVKRIERERQREARESAKRFKEQKKQLEIENAGRAVQDWNNYVDLLQSVHKNCTETIDWQEVKSAERPEEPINETTREVQVQRKINNFKPSLLNKIFGTTQKAIEKLGNELEAAKKADEAEYKRNLDEYKDELSNWEQLQEISAGVAESKTGAYRDALLYFNPFGDISELGTRVRFDFENNGIDVDLFVNGEDVIPDYVLKQTSTGKLSKKDMSKSQFNELYQDHICSCALRVAREVFAYLPIERARINAMANLVNSATGHLEDQPILSVIFSPSTIDNLNLETIDPSDSMKNFVHNMKFTKTKGFDVVGKVELKQ